MRPSILFVVLGVGTSACGTTSTLEPAIDDGGDSSTSGGDASTDAGGSDAQASSRDATAADASARADASDAGVPATGASVLQFHNHVIRDGLYVDPAITAATAATMHRDTTFDGTIVGNVYAQPLYVQNGPSGKGAIYAVTEGDNVYALDETTGLPVWQKPMGTPATQTGAGCGNISPIGITGTPAIDLVSRTIVFDAVTADAGGNTATHTIYGLSIDNGDERWHIDVSTLTDQLGRPFAPQPSNARSAVLIVKGMAYVSYGGYTGDCGNYHGWITGVSVADGLTVKTYAVPSLAAGMWAPGGPASDGTSVFAVTGNREPLTSSAAWNGGEGVFRLGSDLTFTQQPPDFWVPANWMQALDPNDRDLGGSGALIVDAPSMTPSALLVAQGKDGNVYLLDRSNLGGLDTPPLASQTIVGGSFIQAAAFATIAGTTYIALHGHAGAAGTGCPNGTSGDLVTIKLDPAAANKMTVVWCADSLGQGSPIITSSDGSTSALVWTAGAESSNRLHAWDLVTGAPVFAGGGAGDAFANLRHFTTVLEARGRLFVGADNKVYAFKP
jgi:hypothetical protein